MKWPKGWDKHAGMVRYTTADGVWLYFRKDELAGLLATGPDMLAHWDELVGGGA